MNQGKVYLNSNVIILTTSILNIDRLPISSLRIGGSRNNIRFFNGIIDDFRIYNRIITEEEIGYLYTSIDNDIINNSLQIYPNPTSNFINFKAEGIELEKIEIYDILGLKIRSYKENMDLINISDLKNGVYIIKIYDNKGIQIKLEKIIKK